MVNIDWNHPEPRLGWRGTMDRLFGPGATPAELMLQLLPPMLAAIVAPLLVMLQSPDWSVLQYAVCAFMAFDIAGGVITNATSSAKRWYHRDEQGWRSHMGFVLLHVAHLTLVSWVFLELDVVWILLTSAYLVTASLVVLATPLYLRRPAALCLYSVAIVLCLEVFLAPQGMAWFLPLFYLKLLVSHLLREEPYRP